METPLPVGNKIVTHQQAREYGHELLRRNVIEAASRLLMEEGAEALTVRRIAQMLSCSTKIIYTMFKGKDGLADALYLEGCTRLQQIIGQVPQAPDPEIYMHDVAWAYWEFANTYRSYYLVMFCGAIPHFQPSPTSIHTTEAVFETVMGAMQQYMERGVLPTADPYLAAKVLWASLHGVVSLHLMGHFSTLEEAKDVFGRTVQALIALQARGSQSP